MACACPAANTGVSGLPTVFGGDAVHPTVTIQTPTLFDSRKSYPLCLLLHGRSSTPAAVQTLLRMDELKNMDGGVLVVAPQSAVDGATRAWNADACCWFTGSPPNDAAYLKSIVDAVMAAYHVDTRRVWVMGHSNGGFMAHKMAATYPSTFTGIFSVAGCFPQVGTSGYSVSEMHVTHVHGTSDTAVTYAGDPTNVNATDVPQQAYPGAVQTVADWATMLGLGALAAAYDTQEFDADVVGSETSRQAHAGATATTSAELWTMTGSDHDPNFGSATVFNFRDRVMARLRQYVR